MDHIHTLVAAAAALLAAGAATWSLSSPRVPGPGVPPRPLLLAGSYIVIAALAVVVARALERADGGTALLAVAALTVNQLTLALGVAGGRPRVTMAGMPALGVAVLALVASAGGGRAAAAAASVCAAWLVANLLWAARLAYADVGSKRWGSFATTRS